MYICLLICIELLHMIFGRSRKWTHQPVFHVTAFRGGIPLYRTLYVAPSGATKEQLDHYWDVTS